MLSSIDARLITAATVTLGAVGGAIFCANGWRTQKKREAAVRAALRQSTQTFSEDTLMALNEDEGAVISQLRVYPVKGMKGTDLDEAVLTNAGFRYDRQWVVVKGVNSEAEELTVCSSNWFPKLATATAKVDSTLGALLISAPSMAKGLRIDLKHQDPAMDDLSTHKHHQVVNFDILGTVAEEGEGAQQWLREFLGTDDVALCRLMATRNASESISHAGTNKPTDKIMVHDYAALHIICEDGLSWLRHVVPNEEDGKHITAAQFRPNIVVKGVPFPQEDQWARIELGGVPMRVAKQSGRCVIPTHDVVTGERHKRYEPTATLRRLRSAYHRHQPPPTSSSNDQKEDTRSKCFMFGLDLFPDEEYKVLRVGDRIKVLEVRDAPPYE